MNLKRFSGLALGTGLVGLVSMAQSSCSVIVNDFKQQCSTTQDCVDLAAKQPLDADGKPVSGLVCNTDKHVCEPESGCHTNAECQDAHMGEPYLCRASDRTCQPLLLKAADDPNTTVCDILADPDDIRDENTIWLGATVLYKDDSNQGLEMVRQDFNNLAQGLPPATATSKVRRKLAFVYCEANDTLEEGAAHLINDLQLPAVITSLGTTDEITVLTKYSLPNQVFQLSTSAGGAILKSVDNQGLLLDLVLINENYDKETTELVKSHYIPQLRANGGPLTATQQPRVALIHSFTPTAQTTASKMVTDLTAVVGAANVKDFPYGSDDEPSGNPAAYQTVVASVLKFKPHVIIVFGDEEIGPNADANSDGIDVPIEAAWKAQVPGQPPPQWLGILGSVGQLGADINTLTDPDARLEWGSRSLFIQQHYDFNGPQFTSYINQLKQIIGPNDPDGIVALEGSSPFNEFLREGAYLTSYSIALLGAQGKPITGPNLAAAARSFGTQNQGKFTVGREDIFPALQSLASTKQPFDLDNFQGWVGFDENGFAKYTFADDVACMTPGTDDKTGEAIVGSLQPTGGIFETTGELTGTISADGCVAAP